MPREKHLPPPLRTSLDEIQTGDNVMVRNAVLGQDRLASVIEIKQVEMAEEEGEENGAKKAKQGEENGETRNGEEEDRNGPEDKTRSREEERNGPEHSKENGDRPETVDGIETQASTSSTETATSSGPSIEQNGEATPEEPPRKRPRRPRVVNHYYVHYIGTDRRLDEWVDAARIVLAPPGDAEAAAAAALAVPPTPTSAAGPGDPAKPPPPTCTLLTRSQRRLNEDFWHVPKSIDDLDATTRKLELEHEQRTKVKNVDRIQFGDWEIDAWYFSPFPLSITINRSKIYFCEFCLWYSADQLDYTCHVLHHCPTGTPPPGEPIYEDGNLVVYEVRGRANKDYCQSLCLLSKLFLDHKTLYYDVEGFLFYVLCELDERGTAHPVGHFSKELNSVNNLACIMVLPPYQRNGYGKLLIQISYCLSEREGVVGTPERPLSDLGKVSYRSYWWWVLVGVLDREQVDTSISVAELSRLSGIHVDDIVDTFKTLQLIKYWRGDHVVCVSRRVVSQIKQLSLFHAPKLVLNRSAVRTASARESSGRGQREGSRGSSSRKSIEPRNGGNGNGGMMKNGAQGQFNDF